MPVAKPSMPAEGIGHECIDRFRCQVLCLPSPATNLPPPVISSSTTASLRPIPARYMPPRGHLHPRPRYRGGPSSPGLDSTILDPSNNRSHPARVLGPVQPVDRDKGKRKEPINAVSIHPPPISFCLRGVSRCESCLHVSKQEASNGNVSFHCVFCICTALWMLYIHVN